MDDGCWCRGQRQMLGYLKMGLEQKYTRPAQATLSIAVTCLVFVGCSVCLLLSFLLMRITRLIVLMSICRTWTTVLQPPILKNGECERKSSTLNQKDIKTITLYHADKQRYRVIMGTHADMLYLPIIHSQYNDQSIVFLCIEGFIILYFLFHWCNGLLKTHTN